MIKMNSLKNFALLCALTATFAQADEASLRKAIQNTYPNMAVQSVTKTPYAGLYEVYMGGQIIYTDDKLSFLIAEGNVIDPKTKRNLTAERMETLNAIDFSALPLENAIKVVKGNGKRQMAIFSDPDCIYCKKLEQKELAQISDVTMYTFLLPLTKLHPDAANKAKTIWCSADKAKAWTDWMLKGQLADKAGDCATPIDKNLALAEKFNVNGTPALFFASGRRLAGAYPAAEIEQALNKR